MTSRNKSQKNNKSVVEVLKLKKSGTPRKLEIVNTSKTLKQNKQKQTQPGLINKAARGIGNFVGTALGGNSLGSTMGDASAWISKIMGFGDYHINNNTLLTPSQQVPSFSTNGDEVIVKHREFIRDVSSSTLFNNTGYLINAGNSDLFPWLSKIAPNFEEYQFLGLIFEYKTTSAVALNSTNTALGTVVMATDYDSLDALYPDKRAMENSQFWTSTAPSASMIHPIECKPGSSVLDRFFVSNEKTTGAVNGDPRLYFPGLFQFATVGMQNSNVIGELCVSYQVKFMKPQIDETPRSYCHANTLLLGMSGANVDSASITGGFDNMGCSLSITETFPVNASAFIQTYAFNDRRAYGKTYQLIINSSHNATTSATADASFGRGLNYQGIDPISWESSGGILTSHRIGWQNGAAQGGTHWENVRIFKFQIQKSPSVLPQIYFDQSIFDGSSINVLVSVRIDQVNYLPGLDIGGAYYESAKPAKVPIERPLLAVSKEILQSSKDELITIPESSDDELNNNVVEDYIKCEKLSQIQSGQSVRIKSDMDKDTRYQKFLKFLELTNETSF